MASALRDMRIDRIALTPRGADQDADIVLAKSDTVQDEEAVEGANMPDLNEDIAKALGDEAVAALNEEQITAVNESITVWTTKEPAPPALSADDIERGTVEVDDVTYTIGKSEPEPEEIKKTDEVVELEKSNTDLRERMTKMEDEKNLSVRVAKAQADYPHIPGESVADLGVAMHQFEKAGAPEAAVKLMDTVLAAASNAIKEGKLFETVGSSQGEDSIGDEIEKIAKALKTPEMTDQQAVAEAMKSEAGQAAYANREVRSAQGATPAE